MNINKNINVSHQIELSNNSALKPNNSLKTSEKSISSLRSNDLLLGVIERRGSSTTPELELYKSKRSEFTTELEVTYLDENRNYESGKLDSMFEKYQTLYEGIQSSDLSDKDKEISTLALEDTLKRSTLHYTMSVQNKMMIIEDKAFRSDKNLNNSKENIDGFQNMGAYYSNQRNAVGSSIMKLSEKVMEYLKKGMSESGTSLKEYLNGDTASSEASIDNMTLEQIEGFENHLAEQEKLNSMEKEAYLDYFDGKASKTNYQQDSNYKGKLIDWINGFTNYQKIVELYS